MSTIRPLATIAVLFGVGVFLWLRINDAPLVPVDELMQSSGNTTGDASSDEMPSLFDPAAGSGDSLGAPNPITPADDDRVSAAAVPNLPELPAWPGDDTASTDGGPSLSSPARSGVDVPLPQDVPMANYNGESAPAANNDGLGDFPGDSPSTTSVPLATADVLIDPEPPSTPFGPAAIDPDLSPTMAAGEFDPPSDFVTAKTGIEAKLAQGELASALRELTQWYGDDGLTPQENEQVEQLLSQLAGTVVYSTQHIVEPPHQVAAGETLESIADDYQVPWQLLAKINGVNGSSNVTPGQQLKVIRGPFSGVVFIDRQKLALDVEGLYAGRFGVTTQGAAASEGEWVVQEKLVEATASGELSKQIVLQSSAGDVNILLTSDANAGGYNSPYKGKILVAPADENDLFDILSVGSRIIVRR